MQSRNGDTTTSLQAEGALSETTDQQLTRAETNFQSILDNPNAPTAERRNAEAGLRQIEQARSATPSESGGPGAGLQVITKALGVANLPLATVASFADEVADIFRVDEQFDLSGLVSGITGRDTVGNNAFENIVDLVQGVASPEIQGQASFSDVIRDVGGDSQVAQIGRGVAGFGLDVFLDPLNLLGGAGLVARGAAGVAGDVAIAGARRTGRGGVQLTRSGVNKTSLAEILLDDAVNLRNLDPGNQRIAQLQQLANDIEGYGLSRAKRTLDEEQLELLSQYVYSGVTLRRPFVRTRNRIRRNAGQDELAPAFAVGGERSSALNTVFRAGENVADRVGLTRVTPTQRNRRSAARRGELQDVVDVKRIQRQTRVELTRVHGRLLNDLTERLGIRTNSAGSPTVVGRNSGLARARALADPAVGDAVRTAIEAGPNGARTITGPTGATVDVGEIRNWLAEVHRTVTQDYEVALGEVENFFPRILADPPDQQLAERFSRMTRPDQQATLNQREWAPGTIMGYDADGMAVVLREGTVEEVARVLRELDRLGPEGFVNPFNNNLIETLTSYVGGLMTALERDLAETTLVRSGLLHSRGSVRGRHNISYLQSVGELRIFDNERTQELLGRIIPRLQDRDTALNFTDGQARERIDALTLEKRRLRDEATMHRSLRDSFRENIADSRRGVRAVVPNRATATEYLRGSDNIQTLVATLGDIDFQLDELERLRSFDTATVSQGNILREVDELTARRAQVAEELEVFEEVHSLRLRSIDDPDLADALRRHDTAARDLAEAEALVPNLQSRTHQFIRELQQEALDEGRKFRSRRYRGDVIRDNRARAVVMDAITSSELGNLAADVRRVSGDVLSADEFAEIEPALQLMDELVQFDNLSYRTIAADPERALDVFQSRAHQIEDVTGQRLMDAARMLLDESIEMGRQAAELAESYIGELPADVAEQVNHLANSARARRVYAQETAVAAELTELGTPFGGERWLSFVGNMSEGQWQAVHTNMFRELDEFVNVEGRADLLARNESIAEVLNTKAKSVASENRVLQTARGLTQFFKPQATLSPGFSIRNLYSGAHMNFILGDMTLADYGPARRALEAVRGAAIDPDNADEILSALSPRHREIAREIMRNSDFESSRLSDALGTLGTPSDLPLSDTSRAGQYYFTGLRSAGEILDRGVAGLFTQGRVRGLGTRGTSEAADYSVEEFLRFSLMFKLMDDGTHTVSSAYETMIKGHFDYLDLTETDRLIRDTMFPFWTFMSRNLPLQIEQLAKRPQAYNNLVAWQEQTNQRNGRGGLPAGYLSDRLNFTIPQDIWLVGGDQVTPDLQFNDLVARTNQLGEIFNAGGTDPSATFRFILGESSPWTKLLYEVPTQQDAFTGRDLSRLETPVTNTQLGDALGIPLNNALTEVLGAGFAPLGLSARVPTNPADPSSRREWAFTGQANQVLESFLPLLRRQATLAPSDDSRFKERQVAAWISFMVGGIRDVDRESLYTNRAFELSDEAQSLVLRLQEYTVPEGTSVRGRRSRNS